MARRLLVPPLLVVGLALAGVAALTAPARAQFTKGDIYVASWKKTIYKVDPTTWTVTTFATSTSGIDGVSGLLWMPDDTLLAASYYNDVVYSFDSAGTATAKWTSTSGVNGPFGQNAFAATVGGDVYLANWDAKEVRLLPAAGSPSIYADASDGIVHPDGLDFDATRTIWLADRDGKNVLKIAPGGTTTVFDTLPDWPMSIALHPSGDVYVACLYGDVYRYTNGDKTKRKLWLSYGRKLSTPVIRFNLDYTKLLYTSSGKGNLVVVDVATGVPTEVVAAGKLGSPLGLEVVGGHEDIGYWYYAAGTPGYGSIVPSLHLTDHPVMGTTITVQLRGFLGGATAQLVTGFDQMPTAQWGGVFYPNLTNGPSIVSIPLGGTPGNAGEGDADYDDDISVDPAIEGEDWFVQAYCIDPGAPGGNGSLSNTIRVITRSW